MWRDEEPISVRREISSVDSGPRKWRVFPFIKMPIPLFSPLFCLPSCQARNSNARRRRRGVILFGETPIMRSFALAPISSFARSLVRSLASSCLIGTGQLTRVAHCVATIKTFGQCVSSKVLNRRFSRRTTRGDHLSAFSRYLKRAHAMWRRIGRVSPSPE